MSGCCDEFSLEEYVDSFDMGINFLLGPPSPDEVIFIPSVDADGNLSWTNNGGLPNPPTVNIKGPPGSIEGIVPIDHGGTGATTAKAALKELKAFDLDIGETRPAGSDLNDYTTVGVYCCNNNTTASSLVNAPAVGAGFKLIVMHAGNSAQIRQILVVSGANGVQQRYRNSSNDWGAWKKFILESDFPLSVANGGTGATTPETALANLGLGGLKFKSPAVSNGATSTHVVGSYAHGVFFSTCPTSGGNGAYIFHTASSGNFTITPITQGSGLTVSGSGGTLSVTNASGYAAYLLIFYWNS